MLLPQVSLQYKLRSEKIGTKLSYTYVYHWHWCRGIGMHFTSRSTRPQYRLPRRTNRLELTSLRPPTGNIDSKFASVRFSGRCECFRRALHQTANLINAATRSAALSLKAALPLRAKRLGGGRTRQRRRVEGDFCFQTPLQRAVTESLDKHVFADTHTHTSKTHTLSLAQKTDNSSPDKYVYRRAKIIFVIPSILPLHGPDEYLSPCARLPLWHFLFFFLSLLFIYLFIFQGGFITAEGRENILQRGERRVPGCKKVKVRVLRKSKKKGRKKKRSRIGIRWSEESDGGRGSARGRGRGKSL